VCVVLGEDREGDAHACEQTRRSKTDSAELCKLELERVHDGTMGRTMEMMHARNKVGEGGIKRGAHRGAVGEVNIAGGAWR
jgi:hypothetical protein